MRAYIKGLGTFVPSRVVTNADLAEKMDTSDEWIRQRTGIVERRYVEEGTASSDLGCAATKAAAEDAGIALEEIDFIILATLSPDRFFPGTACYMQAKLGLPGVPALDIRQQCTGFVYGLTLAESLVRSGGYRNILLVGAEVHSHSLDFTTRGRDVAVLFGDGAGAAIVSPLEDGSERGILAHALHADGRFAEKLCIHGWDISRDPYMTAEDIEAGEQYPKMEGRYVFKEAVTRVPQVIHEVLAKTGHSVADLDLLVPHQANLRINEAVAKQIGIDPAKVVNNIQRFGNTTAASIALALADARAQDRLHPGDLVCLAALGSGFTWGALTLRW